MTHSIQEFHTRTWNFTCDTSDQLKKIAHEAKRASRAASSLEEKLAFQTIAAKAERGLLAIATIFGERT